VTHNFQPNQSKENSMLKMLYHFLLLTSLAALGQAATPAQILNDYDRKGLVPACLKKCATFPATDEYINKLCADQVLIFSHSVTASS
jgi:hypothetical protein